MLVQDQLHSRWKDRGPGLQTSCLGILPLASCSLPEDGMEKTKHSRIKASAPTGVAGMAQPRVFTSSSDPKALTMMLIDPCLGQRLYLGPF